MIATQVRVSINKLSAYFLTRKLILECNYYELRKYLIVFIKSLVTHRQTKTKVVLKIKHTPISGRFSARNYHDPYSSRLTVTKVLFITRWTPRLRSDPPPPPPLFLVGHDVGYYGPPFFPVGSNFCASVYVHSCISGDVSQPSASLPSSTAFAIYHAFCDYTL